MRPASEVPWGEGLTAEDVIDSDLLWRFPSPVRPPSQVSLDGQSEGPDLWVYLAGAFAQPPAGSLVIWGEEAYQLAASAASRDDVVSLVRFKTGPLAGRIALERAALVGLFGGRPTVSRRDIEAAWGGWSQAARAAWLDRREWAEARMVEAEGCVAIGDAHRLWAAAWAARRIADRGLCDPI